MSDVAVDILSWFSFGSVCGVSSCFFTHGVVIRMVAQPFWWCAWTATVMLRGGL
jgi:hypothetical protein